jgi:hypothetical protein
MERTAAAVDLILISLVKVNTAASDYIHQLLLDRSTDQSIT